MKYDKLFADFEGRSVSKLHGDICYADWDGMHSVKYSESWDWFLPVWKKASDEISGSEYGSTYNGLKAKIMMAICDVNLENACKYLADLIQSDLKMKAVV